MLENKIQNGYLTISVIAAKAYYKIRNCESLFVESMSVLTWQPLFQDQESVTPVKWRLPPVDRDVV